MASVICLTLAGEMSTGPVFGSDFYMWTIIINANMAVVLLLVLKFAQMLLSNKYKL